MMSVRLVRMVLVKPRGEYTIKAIGVSDHSDMARAWDTQMDNREEQAPLVKIPPAKRRISRWSVEWKWAVAKTVSILVFVLVFAIFSRSTLGVLMAVFLGFVAAFLACLCTAALLVMLEMASMVRRQFVKDPEAIDIDSLDNFSGKRLCGANPDTDQETGFSENANKQGGDEGIRQAGHSS